MEMESVVTAVDDVVVVNVIGETCRIMHVVVICFTDCQFSWATYTIHTYYTILFVGLSVLNKTRETSGTCLQGTLCIMDFSRGIV